MLLQSMQQEHRVCTGVEVLHVQTVCSNYEGHTKRDVLQAKEARRAQAMIGNPSEGDFKGMVSGNLIKNYPVTTTDITNARKIFGPDLASIRGKTVQRTPAPVVADFVAVSTSFAGGAKQNSDDGRAYGYFVLFAVCSAICSAKFGFFCQAEHMNG